MKKEGEADNSRFCLEKELKTKKDYEKAIALLVSHIEKKEGLSEGDILRIVLQKGSDIPASIFNEKLTVLESIVKYLKENLGMKYSEIARLTNRDQRTIWATYKKASSKMEERFRPDDQGIMIPVSAISSREGAALYSVIAFLKQEKSLRYSEIARVLKRDQRTIWTAYNRQTKK